MSEYRVMEMTTAHTLRRGVIHVARAESVYPSLEPGSVSLVISDGPYNMRKADWDKFRDWDHFREWYRPHVEAWGEVCAESATVYCWGTQRSVRELMPLTEGAGWRLASTLIWNKVTSPAVLGWRGMTTWGDSSEVCDVYRRGRPPFTPPDTSVTTNIWRFGALADLRKERIYGGRALNRNGVAISRVPVHPCQKPLAFYRRIILASSRPGDLVLEPFGGTCRAAVACEQLREEEARRYVCIEPDEDGRNYVPAVLATMGLAPTVAERAGQLGMFK